MSMLTKHGLLLLWLSLAWPGSLVMAQAGGVVKIYSCPSGAAPQTAERLRTEFGSIPGVRVAADSRTSQVIVQAPAEVQAAISQRMGGGATNSAQSAAGAAEAAEDARPAPAATPPQARTIALRQATTEQIGGSLWRMFANRLSALPKDRSAVKRYRLALVGGSELVVAIDPGTRQVHVEGIASGVEAFSRLIDMLDQPGDQGERSTRLVSLQATRPATAQQAVAAIRESAGPQEPLVATLFQPRGGAGPRGAAPAGAAGPAKAGEAKPHSGLLNPVRVDMIQGLDVLVIQGDREDVEQVEAILKQIERLSVETQPAIELLPLRHVDCQALSELLRSLYNEVFLARLGALSITPLVKPNAVLLVGRIDNVRTAVDLVQRLDQPVEPSTQFQVFSLRYATPTVVQTSIQQFYADRGGLGTLVRTTIDTRTNSLIVQASSRDMAEVAELIRRLDVASSESVNELRVIPLEHTIATDIAIVLQSAIGAAVGGGRTGAGGLGQLGQGGLGGLQGSVPGATGAQGASAQRTAMLRFLTIDTKGQKLLRSGILTDVRVTADTATNALLVSAPAESMELIEALIRQLDNLPAPEAQLKVFTIVNGDATNLSSMLQTLFGTTQATGGGGGFGGGFGAGGALGQALQAGLGSTEQSLVGLRFAVDTRTNSIIASGSRGDLNVIEALLMRLDDSEVRQRKSVVFRLKNAPANDVASAVNTYITNERNVQRIATGLFSAFEQVEQQVVVVAEPVSNSLILSATPRYFEEIKTLIEQLDERPPMVMIQVLIAEVTLGNTDEFGLELGIQDSILFDRSILSNIQTLTSTTTNQNIQTSTQTVVAAENKPGFAFNNLPLGNSGSDKALANSGKVGGQGLSAFSLGRENSTLGFGGLVLSASSENISVLLRALSECHRVDVLERPQIMTLDNQPAYIQVGQRVPRITGTSTNQTGQTNSITLENVGLILGVTPRISPDGLVVMEIDAEKSALGPEAEGIPVSISEGQVIRSPRIDTTTAQTTVSALSGQTVVLGGLIAKTTSQFHRKVPWLGDIPVVGHLFRFDSTTTQRSELLIIMTPHIVKNEADADMIKRAEAARMSWCLSDVEKFYGDAGLRSRRDDWSDSEVQVIYPDMKDMPVMPDGTNPAGAGAVRPDILPKAAAKGLNAVPGGAQPGRPEAVQPAAPQANPSAPQQPAANSPQAYYPQRGAGRGEFQPVVYEQPMEFPR